MTALLAVLLLFLWIHTGAPWWPLFVVPILGGAGVFLWREASKVNAARSAARVEPPAPWPTSLGRDPKAELAAAMQEEADEKARRLRLEAIAALLLPFKSTPGAADPLVGKVDLVVKSYRDGMVQRRKLRAELVKLTGESVAQRLRLEALEYLARMQGRKLEEQSIYHLGETEAQLARLPAPPPRSADLLPALPPDGSPWPVLPELEFKGKGAEAARMMASGAAFRARVGEIESRAFAENFDREIMASAAAEEDEEDESS